MYILDDVSETIYTSSHGKPSRGLLTFVEQEMENDSRFRISVIQEKRLENHVIEKICANVRSKIPMLQYHVILLGGNNLRYNEESVESYMAKCDSLVQRFRAFPNAKLVFVSLIPSPKTHHICQTTFNAVNLQLQTLILPHQRFASFLNVNDIFLPNGRINHALFSDGIHLKINGTQMIAHAISKHVKASEFQR